MQDWLIQHWLEIFGAVSALVYLYFSIRQSIWLWPLGILTSAVSIVVFYNEKIYADMGLNFYYVLISIYGWYHWVFGRKDTNNEELPVRTVNSRLIWQLSLVSLGLFLVIALFLEKLTDSPIPVGDAFTTALSIVATWMLAKKILEQWLVWVLVDAVSLALYIHREMYVYAGLFLVYTIMAVVGYLEWKKSLSQDV